MTTIPPLTFFVPLEFELVEDAPARTNDGRPKRWVVVRPGGGESGLLLARADGEEQAAAGRGFFLPMDDFEHAYERMQSHGVQFVTAPRLEEYVQIAALVDVSGNRWDLLGPVLPKAPVDG